MARSFYILVCYIIGISFTSCNGDKPKPVTTELNKTTVTVNGKKDSVLNNPKDNYGNATIAEPCVKCMITAVQADDHYKKSIVNTPANNISYVVNWVKADGLPDSLNNKKATNGLRLDVIDKGTGHKTLSSFVYDNSVTRLYYINNTKNNSKTDINADPNNLKRIRNGCYWGVASSK